MGPSQSRPLNAAAVDENMLASVLTGQISGDDYLARAHKALTELVIREPVRTNPQSFMEFQNAHLMLEPGPQPLEHGLLRLNDSSWFLACLTDLGTEINGEMFDWWFRHCTGNDRYRWWHPKSHKAGDWDPQFYAAQPEERPMGYYIHHSMRTTEVVAGKTYTFQTEYDRPSKYFDVSKFPAAGVTACVCGRIHLSDTLGLVGIAHVIHMVREVDGRSELRTRIWIGDYNKVDDNSILPLWCVNSLGNSKFYRYTKLPRSFAEGMWLQNIEKMHCLKAFLPDFYRNEAYRLSQLLPFEERCLGDVADDEDQFIGPNMPGSGSDIYSDSYPQNDAIYYDNPTIRKMGSNASSGYGGYNRGSEADELLLSKGTYINKEVWA